MELLGVQRCFEFLTKKGVTPSSFASDRHKSVAKWLRESFENVAHYYDIWHVARTIIKKLTKAAQEKDCERIKEWTTSIRNHLYWCVTTTQEGFGELILAKWKSIMNHIEDVHDEHSDKLFNKCIHERLKKRHWIRNGEPYCKLLCCNSVTIKPTLKYKHCTDQCDKNPLDYDIKS